MTYLILAPVRARLSLQPFLTLLFAGAMGLILSILPAPAAERDRVEAFLNVTGFDVALDSIALSASAAPGMLGLEEGAFGADWNRIADQVFDTDLMHDMALEILEATLEDGPLDHAVMFYASDLGQRLVAAENTAHMADDDMRQDEGARLLAQITADRVALFERMNKAIDGSGNSLRALQEIQIRFLMAASAAGVIAPHLDIEGLRALMKEQEPQLREALTQSSLAGAVWTYRDFSDADLRAYAEALEQPDMQLVYELLNAVQFEIMANRFEVLAARMADLHPGQDI